MRATAMFVGLALVLGLAWPVAVMAAEPDGLILAVDEGMGAGGDRPGMQGPGMQGPGMQGPGMRGPGRPGGWQRGFRAYYRHRRPSFVAMLLRNQQQLGLTSQQVDSLRKLGLDAWRAQIRRSADQRIARLDLMSLRWSDPMDMGKVEAKVREVEKLKGDGLIAAFRTADAAKSQLTPEQKEKLKSLWAARMQQRRGSGEGGAESDAAIGHEEDE
jgi:Spy/CpxP family protein refolding chaperone